MVITSVDRDDLDDGGSNHFFEVINQIRKTNIFYIMITILFYPEYITKYYLDKYI